MKMEHLEYGIFCNSTVSQLYKFLDFDENVLVIGNTY